jgi:glucose-6-phosphate 1-dehydrogenase
VIQRLVVLGGTGDLATRHLLPALTHLLSRGALPSDFRIRGVGLERLTTGEYRRLATFLLAKHASSLDPAARDALVGRLDYAHADLAEGSDLGGVLGRERVVAYLALPPSIYPGALRALRASRVAAGSRVVVEKPFGEDLRSGRELTRLLHAVADECDVFRVDHFLYHQTVQDLLAMRFSSGVFEPIWNAEYIERVDIIWEETASVGGRVNFYDRTGALRDMVQSHLLQLLALVAMELPTTFDERSVRGEKVKVLRRVRSLTPLEVSAATIRGRYTAGTVEGRSVRGYMEEPGVDLARETETFAEVKFEVDLPRWQHVPFLLRTGKALGHSRRQIAVHFREGRGLALPSRAAALCFDMSPGRITFEVQAAGPNGLPDIQSLSLSSARPVQELPPSARMLRDVLSGDPTLTVRDDEAEQCWRIVESVLAIWRTGAPALQDYEAGSDGPRRTGG